MAYPVRNYEPNASKRKPGWYKVPGKGRRYWTGKKWTFGKGDPEGRVNLTGRLTLQQAIFVVLDVRERKGQEDREEDRKERGRFTEALKQEAREAFSAAAKPDTAAGYNNVNKTRDADEPQRSRKVKKPGRPETYPNVLSTGNRQLGVRLMRNFLNPIISLNMNFSKYLQY